MRGVTGQFEIQALEGLPEAIGEYVAFSAHFECAPTIGAHPKHKMARSGKYKASFTVKHSHLLVALLSSGRWTTGY